jgi:hypothetical protein
MILSFHYSVIDRYAIHWFSIGGSVAFRFPVLTCREQQKKAALFLNRCKTHAQTVFDLRNKPTRPSAVPTTPPTNIHIDLSVAEPVKNREMSELEELYASMPKIRRRMPPARSASEIALIMENPSFLDRFVRGTSATSHAAAAA